jgi:hypothetical protein
LRKDLRRHYWLWERAVQTLTVGFPGSAMGAGDYSRFWIREGEVAAWREALRRAGMPPEPPPKWLPKSPVARTSDPGRPRLRRAQLAPSTAPPPHSV